MMDSIASLHWYFFSTDGGERNYEEMWWNRERFKGDEKRVGFQGSCEYNVSDKHIWVSKLEKRADFNGCSKDRMDSLEVHQMMLGSLPWGSARVRLPAAQGMMYMLFYPFYPFNAKICNCMLYHQVQHVTSLLVVWIFRCDKVEQCVAKLEAEVEFKRSR